MLTTTGYLLLLFTLVPLISSEPIKCSDTARNFKEQSFVLQCPAGCATEYYSVWGSDIYTEDSSICAAATHAGIIPQSGGSVTVEKRVGQSKYTGTTRNGVTSQSYSWYPTSYVFASASTVTCSHQARAFAENQFKVLCPADCTSQSSSVWGTDIYTDDSSICRAAIHAGKIRDSGGIVEVLKRPGQSSYSASQRFGVSSRSWGSWSNSFIVI
ncbi:CRLD1 protein, partial [Polyodon spathula]|nr:cysteine-rich secretory protein LCCL domain-containing 2-like [Polyodon spathula]MBN3281310.1 CRLD1 protein [Polyodon spathula]